MIRAGAGQSSSRSTEQAANEAATIAMSRAGISQADFAIIATTADHIPEYQKLVTVISRVTGTHRLVGSSGAGILTNEGEIEGSHGLAVMAVSSDQLQSSPFLFQPLRGRDDEVGTVVPRSIGSGPPEDSLLVLFPDTYNSQPGRMLESIENRFGFLPVVGAGSTEGGSSGATFQVCGDKVVSNAVAGLHLSGTFETSIEITQGCQPVTEPMLITKAERNLIFEIDQRPAFEVFARVVKAPLLKDLRRALMYVFVGLPASAAQNSVASGNYVVRNIVGLDPAKGIMAVGEIVREGEPIVFTLRDAQRARDDLTQMLQRQAKKLEGRSPAFGFYFNCCARGASFYGIADIDTAYIRQTLGDFPMIGMFGGFELAPMGGANHLFAYTGVLALITEKILAH